MTTTAKLQRKKKPKAKGKGFDLGLPAVPKHQVAHMPTAEGFATGTMAAKLTKDQIKTLVSMRAVAARRQADERAAMAESFLADLESQGPEVTTLCETYRLKRDELGRLTGFSPRALADWAANKLPSQPAQRRLREVQRLLEALSELVKVEAIPAWLHKRNSAFEGMTPLQVIEVGEIDRLWGMIYRMSSGQPG